MILYAIKLNGKYLQGIKENEKYSRTGTAPTMGTRYSYSDFKTLWGKEIKYFEYLTASSHLKVLFKEFALKNRKPNNIRIIPYEFEKSPF